MKKKIFGILILVIVLSIRMIAQETNMPYHPEADAKKELKEAIQLAQTSNKHVFIVIGGNWCPWCRHLDSYINEHMQVDSLIQADFIPLKINYSREVKNMDIMKELEYPNRFGFPVIVILNENGERIHTQNSAYLEEGKSYDEKKLIDFLKAWNYEALHPKD